MSNSVSSLGYASSHFHNVKRASEKKPPMCPRGDNMTEYLDAGKNSHQFLGQILVNRLQHLDAENGSFSRGEGGESLRCKSGKLRLKRKAGNGVYGWRAFV